MQRLGVDYDSVMPWWNRLGPQLFAQDAQWAQLRRALDAPNSSYWLQVRQENAARSAALLAQSHRLLAESRECLRATWAAGRQDDPTEPPPPTLPST